MNACDQCGQGNATIQYTEVSRGEVVRVNLCRKCAAANGLLSDSEEGGVEALISRVSRPSRPTRARRSEATRCPTCDLAWDEFEATGSLGCEDCYTTFAMALTRMLREGHQALLQHAAPGKRRSSDPAALLPELRSLLDQAIREEDYEAAASLRDRIQSLQTELEAATSAPSETTRTEPDDDDDEASSEESGGPSPGDSP
jgi:protein arginine kinase activator